jgi:S-disulfanyl-L-cysteine oxidoreductase SoxD
MARPVEWTRILSRRDVMRRTGVIGIALVISVAVTACRDHNVSNGRDAQPQGHYALGRRATAAEIASRDIDVGPDGVGLPPGSGTVEQGAALYAQQCASCHGARGEGMPPQNPRLIGRDSVAEGFQFGKDPRLVKTIGNYWPYATTVFDYVRRAMPLNAPGSLSDEQVYAVTAYLLAANRVIPMGATLDARSLTAVKMPYADRFVRDDRRGGHEVK